MKKLMGWAIAAVTLVIILGVLQALLPNGINTIWTWFLTQLGIS